MSASRIRPGAIAAAVAALPLGYYFLRTSPTGGTSPSVRPAEASYHTPESRGSVAPQRQGNQEKSANERSEALGSEQSTGNFRTVDPSSSVNRGRKHDSSGQNLQESDEYLQNKFPGGQWRSGGAKHSVAIDQDSSKSKKSTGEPETARAQGTVIPGGRK